MESNSDNRVQKLNIHKKYHNIYISALIAVLLIAFTETVLMHTSDASELPEAAASVEALPLITVNTGDTVEFGSYYNEPVSWRVLDVSEDGKTAVLIASHILTMKAYDAAESGKYNYYNGKNYWFDSTGVDTDYELQTQLLGNNDWSVSNIRTWLNSSDEVVTYTDQAPIDSAMCEFTNGYSHEPGFLHEFTDAELSALITVTNTTDSNAVTVADEIITKDRVYLLSSDELYLFEEAGMSIFTTPTQSAHDHDEADWYQLYCTDYNVENFYWWLRDPVEDTTSKCYLVGNEYSDATRIISRSVGVEGFGIRPVITVDLTNAAAFGATVVE